MLFISIFFYLLIGTIICAVTTSKKSHSSMHSAFVVNGIISTLYTCTLFFSWSFIGSFALFFIVAEWLMRTSRPVGRIWLIMLLSGVVVHGAMSLYGIYHVNRIQSLQQSMTIFNAEEPLSVIRSAYPGVAIQESYSQPLPEPDYRSRRMLFAFHQSNVQRFIHSPGFGVSRMPYGSQMISSYQRPEPAKPIPQPGTPVNLDSLYEWRAKRIFDVYQLDLLHHRHRLKFAMPETFGIELEPKRYLGFLPHEMQEKPFASWPNDRDRDSKLRVESVELVGLLMVEVPRVYVTKNLPSMTEAKNAPTRPLDAFEKQGLAEISKGLSTYAMTHRSGSTTKMVGAIRAEQACLKCHECKPGELLVLFTYTLKPE